MQFMALWHQCMSDLYSGGINSARVKMLWRATKPVEDNRSASTEGKKKALLRDAASE
jgi:hypothetical protein